jgi:hypothetical protein
MSASLKSRPRPTAAELPMQIGKYPVVARLGEGATSEVFLARDEFRGVDVAIKRVRVGLMPDSRESHFQRRFFAAEAALVGRLNHPNVVQILDAVFDDEAPYLVMEYVQRRDAAALLPRRCAAAAGPDRRDRLQVRDGAGLRLPPGRDPPRREAGQPAGGDGRRPGGRRQDHRLRQRLQPDADSTQVYRVGSLAYMSPEQLDGDTLDCRADIYSLAAVLYHLIAGRPPFDATRQQAIMHQIYNQQPASLRTLREGVSERLDLLILGALAKDRDERPADWDRVRAGAVGLITDHEVPRGQMQGVLDSERFNLLRSLEFFQGFGDVELWEVVHRARWQRLPFGHAIYRKGQEGDDFHILASRQRRRLPRRPARGAAGRGHLGRRDGLPGAQPGDLRVHSADVLVAEPATTVSFTPHTLGQLSMATRHLFDAPSSRCWCAGCMPRTRRWRTRAHPLGALCRGHASDVSAGRGHLAR